MKLNDVEEILKKISFKIIGFEDGDLMFLSDLIDDLKTIHVFFEGNKPVQGIVSIITDVTQNYLDGKTTENPAEIWSNGFDLLARVAENMKNLSSSEMDELLLNDLRQFEVENRITEKKAAIFQKTSRIKEQDRLIINSESFKIFLVEAEEKLITAQDIILCLEKDLNNKGLIDELFRIFHTIKGECGFLHLASMGELTHNIENLLDLLRNNEIESSPAIIDILLDGIDFSNKMLDSLKAGDITVFNQINIDELITKISSKIQAVKPSIGKILLNDGKISEAVVQTILQKQKEGCYTKKFGEIAVDESYLSEEDVDICLQKQTSSINEPGKKTDKVDPIVKVKASQINYLVDMIGELLIVEDQLAQDDRDVLQLKKITKAIQMAAMQLRTVKIKNLFSNMKRIVRDIAKDLGKNASVEIVGDDLEIDRNLVELLDEPLMHILRNAVCHGIEPDSERIKKNKEIPGKIILKAERRGNNAVILIRDDGKGMDQEAIIKKAIDMSLVSKDKAALLSKQQIFDFIFLPGFSTAKEVDKVSGRGVGMDIVKTAAAASRGKVDVESEKDRFTEIQLSFPLSMAIIDGMIVRVCRTILIIPVSFIIESLQVDKTMIHKINEQTNVIHLREEVIPAIELGQFFNIGNSGDEQRILAVIVETKNIKYAFIVNEIIAKKEIVLKPLNSKFKELAGIASGTILPGGKIGFILDIDAVVSV